MTTRKAPTNEELEIKLTKTLCNKLIMAYSLKQIHTLRDALIFIGHTEGELEYAYSDNPLVLDTPITFPEVKKLTQTITLQLNQKHEARNYDILHPREESTTPAEQAVEIYRAETKDLQVVQEETFIERKHNPNFKARLFPFQQRTSDDIVEAIVKHKQRAQLLRANAGYGKTFILLDALEHLQSIGFFDDCISPWPAVYITKAPIIEQTRRVGQNIFGIDMENFCPVINYDALRSSFGRIYIKWKNIVRDGEAEEEKPVWRPNIHPKVFIIDECQSAMNEKSQQARIICAIANIPDECYIIFSSATPFTTVSRAKYFVINAGIDTEDEK